MNARLIQTETESASERPTPPSSTAATDPRPATARAPRVFSPTNTARLTNLVDAWNAAVATEREQ